METKMTTKNRKNEYKLTHKGFNVLTLALTTKERDGLFKLFHGNTQGEMDWNNWDLQTLSYKIQELKGGK
jgi:hypothetical protein